MSLKTGGETVKRPDSAGELETKQKTDMENEANEN